MLLTDAITLLASPPAAEQAKGRRVKRVAKLSLRWNAEEQRWDAERVEGVATFFEQPAPMLARLTPPRRPLRGTRRR